MMASGKSAESVVRYSKFAGLDKVSDPVGFRVGEDAVKCSVAENVNFTRAFKLGLRDGRELWKSGSFSSLWSNGKVCYGVNGTSLFEVFENGTVVGLRNAVGTTKMSFVDAKNGVVYYSNGVVNGKIKGSLSYPLSGSSDQFKATLPVGSFLSFLSPRVLVARGNVVYLSDPVNRDVFHRESGFMQFEGDVRMVAPIGGTVFVSDEKGTWVLRKMQGNLPVAAPMFKMDKVLGYPAVPGNVFCYLENVVAKEKFYATSVAWLSEKGVCLGGEDGSAVELTKENYGFSSVPIGGTICFRQVGDLNLLISIFKGEVT